MNNGIITIYHVPKAKYVIKQETIPSGYLSLLHSTTINPIKSNFNKTVTFQIASTTSVTKLSSTPITAPSLDNNTLNNWTSFSSRIVSNSNSTVINDVDQVPRVIVAGSQNSTQISASINSTSSVALNTSFTSLTNGSAIIHTIGLGNYSLPNSTSLVSIIPTVVANVTNSSGYIAATPITNVISGQEMIIPIIKSLIPSFGGLEQINVQSQQIYDLLVLILIGL